MANKLTDAAVRARFIEAYGKSGMFTTAAIDAGVGIDHARYFRRHNPAFVIECDAAGAGLVPMRRRYARLTPARRLAFLRALAETGSVAAACATTGTPVDAIYRARRTDATLAADWAEARERAFDRIEDQLFEAALGGFVETSERDGVVTTRRAQRPAAMFKLLGMRRRPARAGGRVIELTPALIAAARVKYDAAMRRAAETGEVPPPPLATLPPPTVTAV